MPQQGYVMKKWRTPIFILLLVGVVCWLAGCALFIDNPYFDVKESGLNWVVIRHYNMRLKPIHRVSIRVDGSGLVTVREGTSLLVTNPFAASHQDPNWNDCRESRVTLPPDEVQPIFQMLVDAGLFEERGKGKSSNTNEAIFVTANIQNKTTGSEHDVFGSDPDFAEQLKNVVMMFYRPQVRGKK